MRVLLGWIAWLINGDNKVSDRNGIFALRRMHPCLVVRYIKENSLMGTIKRYILINAVCHE